MRLLGKRMQVRLKLLEREHLIDGLRVSDEMKIVSREVDNAPALLVLDVGGSNIPLVRHRPIEGRRSAHHFVDRQIGNDVRQIRERLSHSIAGDAATDRKKISRPSVHLSPKLSHFPISE